MRASALAEATWPRARLAEAFALLARRAGVAATPGGEILMAAGEPLEQLVARVAQAVALEAEPVALPYNDVDVSLRTGGPWLLALDEAGEELAVVVGARRSRLLLIGPDHQLHRVALAEVRARVCAAVEAPLNPRLEAMLDEIAVSPRRREAARRSLLGQWLRAGAVAGCWIVRLPPSAPLRARARQGGFAGKLLVGAAAHLVEYGLGLVALTLLLQGFLRGHSDPGLLVAGGLLLLMAALFGVLAYVSVGRLAIDTGVLLKQRLLAGTLALEAAHVRQRGAGQLLGGVIESDAVETLALGGGAALVFSLIELLFAAAILLAAPAGRLAGVLLLGWILVGLQLARRYHQRRVEWTERRLALTNDVVELLLGHRTRLAQEPPPLRHQGEDRLLGAYHEASRSVDAAQALLNTLLPRGWLILSLVLVAPLLASGAPSLDQALFVVAGVLVAYRALRGLTVGLVAGAGALVGWRSVVPVWRAAATRNEAPRLVLPRAADVGETPLLELEHLSFIYPARANAVLRDVSLRIGRGERILLEGESGSGKSTLAAVLSGLARPQHGTLWLGGLDWQTIGAEEWRRHVVFAPQFQENHIMTGTLAFNLLMGRSWPASDGDRQEAIEVCEALGLGDLLARMPARLDEVVGETGWQLSHGEKSRLYIARALLQGADLVILDESFAALDPETLHDCLGCVLERAPTLVVVAHP